MKACIKCNESKDYTDFYPSKRNSEGFENSCKTCKSKYRKAQYLKNREKELAINSEWRTKNKNRYDEICRDWYRDNREYHNSLTRKYYRENKGIFRARDAKRRASLLQATPSWADLEQIKRIYTLCSKVSEKTGVTHHVDHIIPLKGKNVCGLHVETNLCILPARMNLEKSNKFSSWEDFGY
jgi:hypothetical protein